MENRSLTDQPQRRPWRPQPPRRQRPRNATAEEETPDPAWRSEAEKPCRKPCSEQEDQYLRLAGRVRQLPQAHARRRRRPPGPDAKAETIAALPAGLRQPGAGPEAGDRRRGLRTKGVEMTMTQLKDGPGPSWASRRSPPWASPLTPTSTTP